LIALRPYMQPSPVRADSTASSWFVEPGVQMIYLPDGGQVLGKVVIDMRSGNIWGFPTYGGGSYPASISMGGKAPVSHPVPLGRFAVEDLGK
jgi:hypothetical protein